MNLLTAVTELISIFLFTTCFLFIARKVAKRIGLVDKPNFRKRHQGLIPLVGGISVYAGICFTFGIADYYIPHAASISPVRVSWCLLEHWMTDSILR